MEQILLSSPGGHSDWELEQKPSLGLFLLDPEKGASLPKGSKESLESSLDFRETGKELVSLSLDDILQENALNIDNLFRNSRYPNVDQIVSWNEGSECPVLQWENHSFQPPQFSQSEPVEVPNLQISSNEQLEFSISPSVHVIEGDLISDPNPGELLSFNDTSPPSQGLSCVHDSDKAGLSVLEKLLYQENGSSSSSCVPLPSEASPQGVTEEPSVLSCQQENRLSTLSQGVEIVSYETEDKGLLLELARDPLSVSSNAILAGSPESHLSSPSHICSAVDCSQPLGVQERSELLQDDASANISGSLSLEGHSLPSSEDVCLNLTVDDTKLNFPVDNSTVDLSLKHSCDGSDSVPEIDHQLTEPKASEPFPDGDFTHQDGLLDSQSSDQSVSIDLMEEKVFIASTKQEGHEELTADSSLTADTMDDKETPDPKPPEGTLQERLPDLELNGGSGEAELDLDAVCYSQDCPEDPSQELDGLPSGNLRTNKQTLDGLSLSDVGVSNSLPMGGSISEREDLSSLKAVFDALDQDGDGFVRIEEFLQFAAAYGAEQVKDLTRFLDPSGLGVISFEDFYRGITAISNGGSDPQLCNVGFNPGDEAVGPEEYDDYATFEQNEVTDSAYLGSESTYSECETFTDEDTGVLVHPEMHEEVETDSAIDAALHDPEETGSRLSLGSDLNSHSLVTVIGGEEEHFEDFGESRSSDLLLESPGGSEGESSPASQIHCSSMLLSPSTSKRLSSKKVARHLLQSSTLTLDSMDDLSRDILELADTDITDKVLFLEKRVVELEKDSAASGEQHTRLRQENLQLVHRANALEEQLKEQETRSEEALHLEVRRHKDALCKLERERGMELENLQSRLQQLDEENSELRSCVPCLRANIERLEEEKRKLQDEVEDVTERLNEELESRRKMADKLSHERHKNQKEKECTQELIEDLRKQLEHLQLYKLEVEAKTGRSPSAGLQEYQNRTREAELEQEIRRLKQDNRSLKEQNDELNGQIINLSIQGAKNLFATSFSESLAAEINSVSRDELMEAIHKQEEINYRLQDYIDRIIVAIMESNPSILEVK